MIMKNYAPGVINGTLCKLIAFSKDIVHVQLLTGVRQRSIFMLPRCTFHILPGEKFASTSLILQRCVTRINPWIMKWRLYRNIRIAICFYKVAISFGSSLCSYGTQVPRADIPKCWSIFHLKSIRSWSTLCCSISSARMEKYCSST